MTSHHSDGRFRSRHRAAGPLALAVLAVSVLAVAGGTSFAGSPTPSSAPAVVNLASAASSDPSQPAVAAEMKTGETTWPDVVASNVADATTNACDGCRAVSAAFEVVTSSYLGSLDAVEHAVATQNQCTGCLAVAVAEQWVIASTDSIVVLNPTGLNALASIRAELPGIVAGWTSLPQAIDGTNALVAEIDAVLENDVEVFTLFSQPAGASGAAAGPVAGPAAAGPSASQSAPTSVIQEPGYTIYRYAQVSPPAPSS
jgi:hypothetical protein